MIEQVVAALENHTFVVFGFGYSLGIATKNGMMVVERMLNRVLGIKNRDSNDGE